MDKAKQEFLSLLNTLEPSEQDHFLKWTQTFSQNNGGGCNGFAMTDDEKRKERKAEVLLSCIKGTLRDKVPFSGTMSSEKISYPTFGDDKHLNSSNCIHVDAFLYDDDDVDLIVDQGKIQNMFCTKCNSSDVETKTFISHSASKDRMKYIFQSCLPSLKGKTVVDIGSRLGVVLYVACAFTEAKQVVGIELNKQLCDLQKDVVGKYKLGDRVRVCEGDVMDMKEEVQNADVVVLMNVFEWFLEKEQQQQVWTYLHGSIKRGAMIVASPPIDVSLGLIESEIDPRKWLKLVDIDHGGAEFVEETDFSVYEVK